MTASSPIASAPIGADEEETVYLPVSRVASGGIFAQPAVVPELGLNIIWDDGSLIVWDDDSLIAWET